jgi:hypothetical protein
MVQAARLMRQSARPVGTDLPPPGRAVLPWSAGAPEHRSVLRGGLGGRIAPVPGAGRLSRRGARADMPGGGPLHPSRRKARHNPSTRRPRQDRPAVWHDDGQPGPDAPQACMILQNCLQSHDAHAPQSAGHAPHVSPCPQAPSPHAPHGSSWDSCSEAPSIGWSTVPTRDAALCCLKLHSILQWGCTPGRAPCAQYAGLLLASTEIVRSARSVPASGRGS